MAGQRYDLTLRARTPVKKNRREVWRPGRGLRRAKWVPGIKYRKWLPGAVIAAKQARIPGDTYPLRGPLAMTIEFTWPDRRFPDSLNAAQSIEDMLEVARIIGNDNEIARHIVERTVRKGETSAHVIVKEISG